MLQSSVSLGKSFSIPRVYEGILQFQKSFFNIYLAVCLESLFILFFCFVFYSLPRFRFLEAEIKLLSNTSWYIAPFVVLLMVCNAPESFLKKQHVITTIPPPYAYMVLLASYTQSSFLKTWRAELLADYIVPNKSSIVSKTRVGSCGGRVCVGAGF